MKINSNKITHIRQTAENECGLCCIAMIMGYYHFNKTLSFFRKKFDVGRDGLTLYNICKILENLSMNIEALKISNIFKYYSETKIAGPYISHLKNNHYVVIMMKKNM